QDRLADGRSCRAAGAAGDPANRAAVCSIASACLRSARLGGDAADRAGAAIGGLACRLRVPAFALVGALAGDSDGAAYRVAFADRRSNPGDVFSHAPGARIALSGDNGEFTLTQLPPGEYSLTVEMAGFDKEVRRGILLETGQDGRLDVVLKVGSVTSEVVVSSSAPLISSENATVGNVVDQKKIVELPLNGRDYLQLAHLQPNGFAPAQGSNLGFRGGFNVAGNSEIANQYLLDGIDNNDETTNQPLHRPILDAVREFRVLTGTYSAEYGREAGGQVIVTTRSGENDLHGALWNFHRNAPLDARNFFAPRKSAFHRNQFGGVLGGPIRHDRTFFFLGYEGQRRGQQEAGLANVP